MARSNEISTYKLYYRIDEALKEGARYGDATVDITPLAKEYVGASRKNEALAELVSMNAVASRVKHQVSEVSEAELLQRLDPTTPCVTNGRLAPGIQMDVRGLQHTENRINSPADIARACRTSSTRTSSWREGLVTSIRHVKAGRLRAAAA
ncbi:MAG: hypothetical protein ACOH1V_00565 [Stenotrophomonas sp.]